MQRRREGRQKGDFLIRRRKPLSRQTGTFVMRSRRLQELTPDKLCQQVALPVLEEIYPRELVCQVLHDLQRWEQRERKLNHMLMVYLLIAWTLLPTMALKRVWSQLTSALRWLSQQAPTLGLPGAAAADAAGVPATVRAVDTWGLLLWSTPDRHRQQALRRLRDAGERLDFSWTHQGRPATPAESFSSSASALGAGDWLACTRGGGLGSWLPLGNGSGARGGGLLATQLAGLARLRLSWGLVDPEAQASWP